MKTEVTFDPMREQVDGGHISCITKIKSPATEKTNGIEFEISVFQCDCGCPETISVLQTTTSKEDPANVNYQHISISPEHYQKFIAGLHLAYEEIISKKN